MSSDELNLPVIVGVGQVTANRERDVNPMAPLDLVYGAAQRAIQDTDSVTQQVAQELEAISYVRGFSDSNPRFASPFGRPENPPWSLMSRLGASTSKLFYGPSGGNSPQLLVNRAAQRIAAGETALELIAGGEALKTQLWAQRTNVELDWAQDAPVPLVELDKFVPGFSQNEIKHGLTGALLGYPLIEQRIRTEKKSTIDKHLADMGQLFAKFSAVAHQNEFAARREKFDASTISTVTEQNPWIVFPYTKLLCSNGYVDQAAAVVMCSVAKARELGIPEEKWVYLHGMAEGAIHPYLSERKDLTSVSRISAISDSALQMAEMSVADIDCFDIYSCFPSAVTLLTRALGLDERDPRPLTVTGGLAYFGGPGNNYSTHAIVSMVERLRHHPEASGLVMANGGIVTKHAVGVYSRRPPAHLGASSFVLSPTTDGTGNDKSTVACNQFQSGNGVVDTYTLSYRRGVVDNALVIGRLESGDRFLANVDFGDSDPEIWTSHDVIGRTGQVQDNNGKKLFTLAA